MVFVAAEDPGTLGAELFRFEAFAFEAFGFEAFELEGAFGFGTFGAEGAFGAGTFGLEAFGLPPALLAGAGLIAGDTGAADALTTGFVL